MSYQEITFHVGAKEFVLFNLGLAGQEIKQGCLIRSTKYCLLIVLQDAAMKG